ncbi:helix-turn-helix domain-containing protein [Paracraurococcus lichenis]|uniref:Helix-turn-helix transcriptional regulator n=1 Tax=Paracraurococcus lichenis TaxID=3064888 RepID=A0ABT9EB93_9PROT|nr:helix-turn-helix transcriptional regulator [Paracraurococcus sp. LOR1-02]MDO9713449.1 helix-turn-helix transcriptional regulator [Paracraurococcus sp. LOR1-02]
MLTVQRPANVVKDATTASQVRAARALLAISQRDLAARSGVPLRTLARIEAGEVAKPRRGTMQRLSAVLREAGVEFIPANGGGPGVRLTREAALREAVEVAKGG